MLRRINIALLGLTSLVFVDVLVNIGVSQAQVIEDSTLSTRAETLDDQNFRVTGGRRSGGNLFHSFLQFSIPLNGSSLFENQPGIRNIFARITGQGQGSISLIEGELRAQHSANVFFLNPNGIVFGPQARLDIGGSFIASSAKQLIFADGAQFGVESPPRPAMLTVSAPVGLQFGANPGEIQNQSRALSTIPVDPQPIARGLQVGPQQTLGLVGGNINLEGGNLSAPSGRIELGSVVSSGQVDLLPNPDTPDGQGWVLGYKDVQQFGDIRLSNSSFVDTTGTPSGTVHIQGDNVLLDSAQVGGLNFGLQGGGIQIIAADLVELKNNSSLLSDVFISGQQAGNIDIQTQRLVVRDGSAITSSVGSFLPGSGGGTLTISADQSVELIGKQGQVPRLSTESFTNGDAGNINVTTTRLVLQDGGQIEASNAGLGDSGRINLEVSDLIEIKGQGLEQGEVLPSGIFANINASTFSETTGDAGVLSINTQRLTLQQGGQISISTLAGSTGQAGTANITATDSLQIQDPESGIFANSFSSQPGGDLILRTGRLELQNQGQITVDSSAEGSAGNIDVQVQSITLNDQSILSARSQSGDGGNLFLEASNLLQLRNNSNISTSSLELGDGGNITIFAPLIVAIPSENSDISTDAFQGNGGRININTQGIFGIEFRSEPSLLSDITANSESGGIEGEVIINSPEVDPRQDTLQPLEVNRTPKIVQSCSPAGGARRPGTFTNNGRGGLPPNPTSVREYSAIWHDIRPPTELSQANLLQPKMLPQQSSQIDTSVSEAKGWVSTSQGLKLIASEPSALTLESHASIC